jgi:hypothetical protein
MAQTACGRKWATGIGESRRNDRHEPALINMQDAFPHLSC